MNKPGKQRTSWGGEHTLRVQESLLSRAGTLGPTLLASLALWQKWYPLSRPFYHLCKATSPTSPTSLKHTHDVSAFRSHQYVATYMLLLLWVHDYQLQFSTQTARYPSMILWSAYSSKVWGKYLPSSSLTANIMPHPLPTTFSGWPCLTIPNRNRRHQKFSPLPIISSTGLSVPVNISGKGVFCFSLRSVSISPWGQICHILLYSTPICILRIFVPSSILPLSIHPW